MLHQVIRDPVSQCQFYVPEILQNPKLIERGTKIHPLLILLSVLGGIGTFGFMGLLIGPLVLSFLLALLSIYPTIFKRST